MFLLEDFHSRHSHESSLEVNSRCCTLNALVVESSWRLLSHSMSYLGRTKFACHTGNVLGVILVALNSLSLTIVRNLWMKSGFTRSPLLSVSLFDHQHGNSCIGNFSVSIYPTASGSEGLDSSSSLSTLTSSFAILSMYVSILLPMSLPSL